MSNSAAKYFDGPNGRLAYRRLRGRKPTVVWLGGFNSDMTGTKASFLEHWARKKKRAFLRFDYSGHGASDGAFEEGCVSDWAADAEAIVSEITSGPVTIVGSSMGAWIGTLLIRKIASRVAGAVFIAPAPDFTEALMWPSLDDDARDVLEREGRIEETSPYGDEPTVITRRLIEDGRRNLVLDTKISIDAPVRILQGMADTDVPYAHALRFAEAIESPDLIVGMTGSGDHRLSTDEDLARLAAALQSIPAPKRPRSRVTGENAPARQARFFPDNRPFRRSQWRLQPRWRRGRGCLRRRRR